MPIKVNENLEGSTKVSKPLTTPIGNQLRKWVSSKGKDARIVIKIGFRGWGLGIRSKP
jgi:hypothetical protein